MRARNRCERSPVVHLFSTGHCRWPPELGLPVDERVTLEGQIDLVHGEIAEIARQPLARPEVCG